MFEQALDGKVFRVVAQAAREQGVRAFVIGGYVRDFFLQRPCNDIDIVVEGSGIALAEAVAAKLHTKVTVFKSFGTAMLRSGNLELEFVGARRESYRRESRKPIAWLSMISATMFLTCLVCCLKSRHTISWIASLPA